MSPITAVVAVCFLGVLIGMPVEAGAIYDTQGGFLAALPPGASTAVETFDGVSMFPPSPLVFPALVAELSGAFGGPPCGSGFLGVTSGADTWLSTQCATDGILFTLSTPVRAVGGFFFPTGIDGQVIPGTVEVIFVASDGGASRFQANAGSTTFLGYIPDFGEVTGLFIGSVQNVGFPEGTFVTANDLTSAAPVPEPKSAALLAIGMLLASFRRKILN